MIDGITKALTIIKNGGIIAYPTEAVYGLGCDPFNEQAVKRLLAIKQRPIDKGLILIASSWEQLKDLVQPLSPEILQKVFTTWPGPVTWVFPASSKVPKWISGDHASVALRVTAHPLAKQICEKWGNALVSTSANIAGQPPAYNAQTVKQYFASQIDYILEGELGGLNKPTEIRDVLSGKFLRF